MLPNVYHSQDNVQLEIEVPNPGLPNLVKNPSGDKGAWWWQTPTANTLMSRTGSSALQFTTTVSQACNFTTDFMPVAQIKYVGARFDISSITGSHNVKVTFDWYDASKTLLSSSAQSAALNSVGTNFVPAQQSPLNTVYVKARFNFYNSTGNPNANSQITFTKAMVTWGNSSTISSVRTNLVPNPSMEVDEWGWLWIDTSNPTGLARSTAQARVGTASLSVQAQSAGAMEVTTPRGMSGAPITGGATYTMTAYARAATVNRLAVAIIRWYSSTGAELGSTSSLETGAITSGWTALSHSATAPAAAAYASVGIKWNDVAAGEVHYLDTAIFERAVRPAGSPPPWNVYFDGASTSGGTLTYAWTGTAHRSASTESNTAYAFGEPNDWRNVLGPTFEIGISRRALDVGTLTAKINDELLDPAVTSDIRPGKLVRLRALIGTSWESVYEGKLTTAHVDYEKDPTPSAVEKTIITLNAVDNVATLANRAEPRGLSTIASLPYLLEDKGVPWNCNGSTGQVTSATQVSANDNASALDQVAIARDSALGYAWVDRKNTLQVWDGSKLTANVFPNPGFEVDTSSWAIGTGVAYTLARTTAQFHSGVASGQVTTGGTAGNVALYPSPAGGQAWPVDLGGTYTVEVWTKAATTARTVQFYVEEYRLGVINNGTQTSTGTTNTTTGWTKHSFTFTVQPNTDAVNTTVRILGTTAGEVHYIDDMFMSTPTVYTDTASTAGNYDSYTSIDADFDTGRCINEVNIKWLRYNPSTGETTEVPYGPYRDQSSIDAWGPFSSEFTIHGSSENSATIAAYANSILAANATPKRRANAITATATNARSFRHAVLVDLYSLVHVTYGTKVDEDYRVTGIQHAITPEKWLTTYNFDVTGSVAAPQVTPAPPTVPGGIIEGVWIAPTLLNGWSNYGSVYAPAGYMRKNGVVYLRGLVKTGTVPSEIFTLPAGFRPAYNKIMVAMGYQVNETTGAASAGTAHTHPVPINQAAYRVDVQTDGDVYMNQSTGLNNWVSLEGISFPADQ